MSNPSPNNIPLAERLRPTQADEIIGQDHILAPGKPLREAIDHDKLHSMVLWGPPGCGKTTLARLMSLKTGARFASLSAVFSGVADIRREVKMANEAKPQPTVLFVDEVHRFNKAQQDAFLPYIEDGTLIFIGATTENPSFELNNALLSRCRVYILKAMSEEATEHVVANALAHPEIGFPEQIDQITAEHRVMIAQAADGDARRAIILLELVLEMLGTGMAIDAVMGEVLQGTLRRFDKGGDDFYEQISALHKAVRGSSPDGALYWLSRMLDGGCDPLYIARRVVRMASEDIGNADPRAMPLALTAWEVQERLGSPEGELALAQAVSYLACAPKSNAVYTAFKASMQDARTGGSLGVPMHLRNAPTGLMKNSGYGHGYRYSHDEQDGYSPGQTYFPDEMGSRQYYHPVNRGLEIRISEKLTAFRERDKKKVQ